MAKKVLLIDDSATIKRAVEICLKNSDSTLLWVSLSDEILPTLENEHPDIILVDANFPKEDGYSLTARIKKQVGYENVPIILLVSTFDKYNTERGANSKVSGYLIKPFESTELIGIIDEFSPTKDVAVEVSKESVNNKIVENQINNTEVKKSVEEINDIIVAIPETQDVQATPNLDFSTIENDVTGRKDILEKDKPEDSENDFTVEKTEIDTKETNESLFSNELDIEIEADKDSFFSDKFEDEEKDVSSFDKLEDKRSISQSGFLEDDEDREKSKDDNMKFDLEEENPPQLTLKKDEMDLWNEESSEKSVEKVLKETYREEETFIEEIPEEPNLKVNHEESVEVTEKRPQMAPPNIESMFTRENIEKIVEQSLRPAIQESIDKVIPKLLKEIIEEKIEKLLREKNRL